jgi:hypothetical protein
MVREMMENIRKRVKMISKGTIGENADVINKNNDIGHVRENVGNGFLIDVG